MTLPALKQAEVGIAVSNATDVAKGSASVVLTEKGLSNIVDLVANWQNDLPANFNMDI